MKRIITFLLLILMWFSLSTCGTAQALPSPDHRELLKTAVLSSDPQLGHKAEQLQLKLLKENPGSFRPISYDDLLLLSRFISADSEGRIQSDEYLMCVGELILNRVASPEFPDSIEAVIYDPGQYSFAETEDFKCSVPDEASVEAALRLLNGERLMKSSVVFKSKADMGTVYASFCDRVDGFTYFCESPNAELYTLQNYPREKEEYKAQESFPSVSVSADSFRDYKDSSIIVINNKYQ